MRKRRQWYTRAMEIALVAALLLMILVPTCQRWRDYQKEWEEQRAFESYMEARQNVEREIQDKQEREQ